MFGIIVEKEKKIRIRIKDKSRLMYVSVDMQAFILNYEVYFWLSFFHMSSKSFLPVVGRKVQFFSQGIKNSRTLLLLFAATRQSKSYNNTIFVEA